MSTYTIEKMAEAIKDIPRNPSRRMDTLPGLRWKNAFDRRAMLLPLIFLGFFLFFPVMMFTSDPTMRLQFKQKARVEGKVTVTKDRNSGEGRGRDLEYSFETKDHQQYLGSQVVYEHSPYFQAEAGTAVPIIYAEGEPALNGIDGLVGQDAPPLALFLIFPFFPLVFFGLMLLPSIQSVAKARKIFKQGTIVDAEIVFIKKRSVLAGFHFPISRSEVYYTYKNTRDEQVESKTVCDNDWLVHKLDIGTPIHVAYVERSPRKSVILEAFIR